MTAPNNPVYNPNVPEENNYIGENQEDFLGNFATLFTAFNENHVSLIDPTNPGNHSVIQLTEQTQGKTTQSQEISIYSKDVPGQTTQLFMRYQNNGKEFQISEYQIYSIPVTDLQEAYFSFLPGGVIVYFGRVFSAGKKTFNIGISPTIKTNISGINLSNIGNIPATSQSNVSLEAPINGVYSNIILNSIFVMPDQFYLFFGNL